MPPAGASNRKKIVVANGCHRFHMYHTALAYEQAGRLSHFIAGWYLTNPAAIGLLKSPGFARVCGTNLAKRLLARHQEGLDPERVVSLVLPDLIERLGRSKLERFLPPGFFSYWSMRAFGRLAQRYVQGAALLHVRSGYGRFAMAQAKRNGAVCLVDHSIADPRFIRETMISEAARWGLPYGFAELHWRCVSQDIDDADHILVNSDFVRNTLVACRGISAEKIAVLPLPVDQSRFSPRAHENSKDKFRILFVGEIGLRKGVLYLLKAFKKLKLPNAELVLVGGVSEIGELLARSGVKFSHIPQMPQADLVPYIQNSSVFVFPSLIEGSARVIQEAMACGLPVITTPNSGSFVRDGVDGFIVPIRDVEALCDRILELYDHPERRAEMGSAAGRHAAQIFTPQRYYDGLLQLYRTLCPEAGR